MGLVVKKINVGEVASIKGIYKAKNYEKYLFNDYRLYDTYRNSVTSVSYTHLTLPTNYSV